MQLTGILCLVIGLSVIVALPIAFAVQFYREVRRASWGLLEALIAFSIFGHVIALPVAWQWQRSAGEMTADRTRAVAGVALLATFVAFCMAAGAVWVFRRLRLLGEKRTGVRLVYMLLGILLFPSMVAVPYNFVVGWIIWIPLIRLHFQTRDLVAKAEIQPPTAVVPDEIPSARE
jgi:amino acid transporter